MNKRWLIAGCVLFLLVARPVFARDKTDVLVLKNGDRVTCQVKGLDAGVLYVSLDWADGTVSVDWSKVARIESTQLFVVKTSGGEVYTGALRTSKAEADQPVELQVFENTAKEPVLLNRTRVVSMIATSDKFWERFNGELSAGFIYAKANQSAQYNLGSQTLYVRERWNASANYQSSLSATSGSTTSTRNSVTLGYDHLLPDDNWFYAGLGNFLQSGEQEISLQTTLGGGIGRYLKNTDRTSISLVGGVAWQRTDYNVVTDQPGQNVAAALIFGDVRFFKFSKTTLNITGAVTPALTDPGRVRIDTNASYYIKIIGNLKWNVSFYGNWDNRPPFGVPGSDYGSSSGLSWTYGLK